MADTCKLLAADKKYLWHPFTQMRDWTEPDHQPLLIEKGEGAWLIDAEGNRYLDGNSSIWTNIHGHNHPVLNEALRVQSEKISHSSFLGFTNQPAIELAEMLVKQFPSDTLSRVFYSDDGSTAMECALRMALEYHQHNKQPERQTFLAFDSAYHGDTLGAASLGGIAAFKRVEGMGQRFGVPTRHLKNIEELRQLSSGELEKIAGLCIEPLIQGVAGMRPWEEGMLEELRTFCDEQGILLIYDEVMTGFGRTGELFAATKAGVMPDLMAVAKGLTGGYLPLAATLCTEKIYEAFLGSYEESKTFYYGHSYCGNPLGCAVALASLKLFESEKTLERVAELIPHFEEKLAELQQSQSRVSEVRSFGLMAGIDLCAADGAALENSQIGAAVCQAARQHGLLTRPILNTIVLMPPLCVTREEIDLAIDAIDCAIVEVIS